MFFRKLRDKISLPFIRANNKALVKKFPFLKVCRDEPNYYDSTWLDSIPYGWRKSFGIQLCKDILLQCNIAGIDSREVTFLDIKEKWGVLNIDYSCHAGLDLDELFAYYEDLSLVTCINCGRPTKYETRGWINYICEKCAKNKEYAGRSLNKLTVKEHKPIRSIWLADGTVKRKESIVDFSKYWPEE